MLYREKKELERREGWDGIHIPLSLYQLRWSGMAERDPNKTTGKKEWDSSMTIFHKVLTYIEYRAVSDVFQNSDPSPSSPPSECGRLGGGGQYFGRRQP
jgi:hypothetical protein